MTKILSRSNEEERSYDCLRAKQYCVLVQSHVTVKMHQVSSDTDGFLPESG